MEQKFRDRRDAGRTLAEYLRHWAGEKDVVVLALPRGGVPVAYEVARKLEAPLDVFLVRKLGMPGHEELAMGAIASGGVKILNPSVVRAFGIRPRTIDEVAEKEQRKIEQQERLYRASRPFPTLEGKTVILIDDGLATGSSMRAAIAALRHHHPGRIIVAVPIAALETCEELQQEVDQLVCARTPDPFVAVGLWYDDFSQTSDEEVRELLESANPLGLESFHSRTL